jgi:hypothetical protein
MFVAGHENPQLLLMSTLFVLAENQVHSFIDITVLRVLFPALC